MNQKCFVLLLLCLGWMHTATAVTVDDLYTVEVPIADQTTSLRLAAFKEAFMQVIVKVSGSDDALQSAAFVRPIEGSSNYVKQYSYVNREASTSQELDANVLYLKVEFNQLLIEKLLRGNNFPIWGRERPGSLLVVSYDVNENVKLVSGDSTPDLADKIYDSARKQGLPILFPLMDLEDISLVRVGDVVSRNVAKIDFMASRYSPDALVVGQLVGRSGLGWQGDWEVRFDEQIFKWRFNASSQQAVVDELVKHLARVLALEFALESDRASNQDVYLNVSTVKGIKQLISVQKYLQSLNVVETVRVALVEGEAVSFKVKLRNDVEDLQRLIEFGEVLVQEDYPRLNTQNENAITLNYSFIDRDFSN